MIRFYLRSLLAGLCASLLLTACQQALPPHAEALLEGSTATVQPAFPSAESSSPEIFPTADPYSDTGVPMTKSPTTEVPTTELLTTEAPTTVPPTTEVPTTIPPATDPPATNPPATDPPTTDPVTEVTSGEVSPTSEESPTAAEDTPETTETPTVTEPPINETSGLTLDRHRGEEAFHLQNQLLIQNDIPPLLWSESLYQIASQRVQEISLDYSHDGCPDWTGENILMGTTRADLAVQIWYESDGHRRNMLAGWSYGAIANYGHYWAAIFAMVETP